MISSNLLQKHNNCVALRQRVPVFATPDLITKKKNKVSDKCSIFFLLNAWTEGFQKFFPMVKTGSPTLSRSHMRLQHGSGIAAKRCTRSVTFEKFSVLKHFKWFMVSGKCLTVYP